MSVFVGLPEPSISQARPYLGLGVIRAQAGGPQFDHLGELGYGGC